MNISVYQYRLLLNRTDKINLKLNGKYVALKLSIYNMWKNLKKSYKNIKTKISGPTRTEEFKLWTI